MTETLKSNAGFYSDAETPQVRKLCAFFRLAPSCCRSKDPEAKAMNLFVCLFFFLMII